MNTQRAKTKERIMKIYVFDIDGNLLFIPTVFYMQEIATGRVLKFKSWQSNEIIQNMNKLGLRFHRSHSYSMRNFRGKLGDKVLLKEIKNAEIGPSWSDFVSCINSGSFFGVITARGNSLKCLQDIFKNFIKNSVNGISYDLFFDNVLKNRSFLEILHIKNCKEEDRDKVLDTYITECCSFYARNSKDTKRSLKISKKTRTPEFKLMALKDFEGKMEKIIEIGKVDLINEIIEIGFSDDEEPNCLVIKKYCQEKDGKDIFKRRIYKTENKEKVLIF